MKRRHFFAASAAIASTLSLAKTKALANEGTSIAQDPTTPTEGTLPRSEPAFKGKIGRTSADSVSDFPQPYRAPEGSPNILLVMTDDVGFGASSTFGGPIPTPTFDKLAQRGIKYNRFHTTALCSPTRAALITGRHPHNANTGIIMERSLGYPGYNSVMSKSCGTVAEILRQNGYNTAWFGKNHNIPDWLSSAVGSFDLWPTGLGFEYFYGFIGGDCNQWEPAVYEGTTPIEPHLGKPDYHLDTDLADQAIHWIQQQNSLDPDKPFFAYYVPGATHAPHHVPQAWIDKFKGQFNHGWDKQREITFENQKRLGVIPADAELTPRPDNIPAWDSLSTEQKDLYIRMMEIYAAFLAFTDHNIGRVIEAVEQTGQIDNTLIIYIQGDNGGSAEGTLQGTANELAIVGNGETESLEYLVSIKGELGGPMHYNHFPVPWSWAMNSPMQWTKRYASHFGGMRNGMVMSWPKGIKNMGSVRDQFHHVIDIAPTLYEITGIIPPAELNGVEQKPIDGISMAYTWDNPQAQGHRQTIHFEMFGNRGIYHEGWMACTTPLVFAWEPEPKGITPDSFEWELYNLNEDFTQYNNLAQENPQKLKELQDLWWAEAEKNNVLPLNFSPQATIDAASERPSLTRGRNRFEYYNGTIRIPEGTAPGLKNISYTITAQIVIPSNGAEGVIVTQGGRFAGWGLVLLNSKPVWVYKRSQQPDHQFKLAAPTPLSPGAHTLTVNFAYDGGGVGKGGTFTLGVDGQPVASGRIERSVPARFSVDETLDIGEDMGTPILEDYAQNMPFKFTGQLDKVIIDLDNRNLSASDRQQIRIAERTAALNTD
jgi:arylsulfatase